MYDLAGVLYSVFYDEKIGFVALAGLALPSGAILTSRDGLKWNVNRTTIYMQGRVAVGNGVILSVTGPEGYGSAFSVSTNGVNYTRTDADVSSYITFVDGQFLNLGGGNRIVMASRDAVSWRPLFNMTVIVPSPPAGHAAYVISMVRAQSGPWAALVRLEGPEWYELSKYRTFLARSDDNGRSWKNVTELPLGVGGALLASVNNTFILSGQVFSGETSSVTEMLYLRSADAGMTWHTAPAGIQQIVTSVNGRFVSSCHQHVLEDEVDGLTQVSNDLGLTWQSTDPGITAEIYEVMFADGTLLIVTDNGLYASYDNGVTWARKSNISLTSVTYNEKHKRWYGTLPEGQAKYGHTLYAVANDVTRWDLIPGPVTPTYIELLDWQIAAALLTPEGHWIIAIACTMHVDTNSSNSMSSSSSGSVTSMRVYLSNATGGWDFVNATAMMNDVDDISEVTLTSAHGITALEVFPGIVVSYDSGRTWHIVRKRGSHVFCQLARGDNIWLDTCFYPKAVTYYAYENNLTDWRTVLPAADVQCAAWVPPNDKVPQGQFFGGGKTGQVWRMTTDATVWHPVSPIPSLDKFCMWAASSSGTVVAIGDEDMIYTSDSFAAS